jgi:peptidoglycan/LPS O-acetylase OafA/YrhL
MTALPSLPSRSRITEFEGLRGVLAWVVVASHLLLYANVQLPARLGYLVNGSAAVDVFIVLSGFVITMMLARPDGGESYGVFVLRRFLRLFPTYVVCLLLAFVLTFYALQTVQSLPWTTPALQRVEEHWQLSRDYMWTHLLVHLTMLHGLVPDQVLPFSGRALLGPAWSVSLEWQFYLVAPFVIAGIRRPRVALGLIAAVVVCGLLARYLGPGKGSRLAAYSLPSFLPLKAVYFCVGIASYHLSTYLVRQAPPRLGTWCALAVGLVGLLVPSLGLKVWAVVLAVTICRSSGIENLLVSVPSRLLTAEPVQWLGRVSYSTYLVHSPIVYGSMMVLLSVKKEWTNVSFFLWLSALTIAITIPMSALLHHAVELPGIRLGKSLAGRSGARRSGGEAALSTGATATSPVVGPVPTS